MTAMPSRVPTPGPRSVQHASCETIEIHGGLLSFLAVGEQTGGAYALIETANHPSTGVPLYVHECEDETWFIVEGEYAFWVGGQTCSHVRAITLFGPRNVPHSYANRTVVLMAPFGSVKKPPEAGR